MAPARAHLAKVALPTVVPHVTPTKIQPIATLAATAPATVTSRAPYQAQALRLGRARKFARVDSIDLDLLALLACPVSSSLAQTQALRAVNVL